MTEVGSERVREARRALVAYLALVAVASGWIEWRIFRTGDPIEAHPWLAVLNMWTPAIVSFGLRIGFADGVRDISLRWGGRAGSREALRAWIYPILVGGLAYGAAWASGLAHMDSRPLHFFGLAPTSTFGRFGVRLALAATLVVPLAAISAAGEELGWRGYMLTRLVDARVPHPVLTSGLIWGMWHVPLIVSGQYAAGPHPWLSACIFVITIQPAAFLHARVRLASGSVWPAVMAHAAWNAIIQGAFDPSTVGGGASQNGNAWTGESGVLVAAASVLVALVLIRGPWSMRRSPRDEPEEISP